MKRIKTGLFAGFGCMLVLSVASFSVMDTNETKDASATFEGTSPCGASSKSFLKIPPAEKCDAVKWKLVLNYDGQQHKPSDYTLTREYIYYVDNRTNQSQGVVSINGKWEIVTGTPLLPEAVVYRLYAGNSSISFIKIAENLIHLLEPDNTLAPGVDVQSFTLSRTDGRQAPSNKRIKISSPLPKKGTVSELKFTGRTPCQEIATELNLKTDRDCFKLKWALTLYFDPNTHQPSTYELARTYHRQALIKGNWRILKGSPADPDAVIYQLDSDKPHEAILLLRADENILFFLDKKRNPLVGNADFSYTLNRKK